MKSKKVVRTEIKGTVIAYSELWRTSKCLLIRGCREEEASNPQFSASLVFTAFTMEAYLNHLGDEIFNCWNDLEFLSPMKKLNVIADRLEVDIDKSKRPWQTLNELFKYRDTLAHGKTQERKNISQEVPLHKFNQDVHKIMFRPTEWWEEYCTKENAERAREDIEKIVKILHQAAGLDENQCFLPGSEERTATLIEKD